MSIAWAIGRVLTDRVAAIQSLHWIPTLVALAITLICAFLLCWSNWRHARRILWMIACLQAVIFLVQDYAIARTTPTSIAQSDSAIHIAHINVSWPSDHAQSTARNLSDSFRNVYGENGPDVFFISEYAGMLRTDVINMYCPNDAKAISIGRFAVVSRVRILEAILLYDDAKSTAAFVRFAPFKGNASWGALLVDLPSNPSISRFKMLSDLRSRLDALETPVPDIILGDFNTARGGAAIETFAPNMRNAFDVAGVGFGATYPRIFPLLHIDQLLLGPRVRVRHYEIIDTGSGVHRMQIATILVNEKPD